MFIYTLQHLKLLQSCRKTAAEKKTPPQSLQSFNREVKINRLLNVEQASIRLYKASFVYKFLLQPSWPSSVQTLQLEFDP